MALALPGMTTQENNGSAGKQAAPSPQASSPSAPTAPAFAPGFRTRPPVLTLPPAVDAPSVPQAHGQAHHLHPASYAEYQAAIGQAQQGLHHNVLGQQSELLSGHGNYAHLLSNLLMASEEVLHVLPIDSVLLTVAPGEPEAGMSFSKPGGHVVLTSERLVLLCSSPTNIRNLNWNGFSQESLMGSYALTQELQDVLWFFPIQLHLFRHLAMEATASIRADATVYPQKPTCWECGFCFRGCCRCRACCCVEDWAASLSAPSPVQSRRTLCLGVLLPPWEQRHMLTIQVSDSASLAELQVFVAKFQMAGEKKTKMQAPARQNM